MGPRRLGAMLRLAQTALMVFLVSCAAAAPSGEPSGPGRPADLSRSAAAAAGGGGGGAGSAVAPAQLSPAQAAPAPPQRFKAILEDHNELRAKYQAPPLSWSRALATSAAAWVARCDWDAPVGVGENAYGTFAANERVALGGAVDLWAQGAAKYNWSRPGYSYETGTFTQVVWKSSQRLGCAVRICPDGLAGAPGLFTAVLCKYDPPGNFGGPPDYNDNVLPANASSGPVVPPASTDLPAGASLAAPACLVSPDQRYSLCLRSTGKLVLFQQGGRTFWSNGLQGRAGPAPLQLRMQLDNDLVLYTGTGMRVWSTGTAGKGITGPGSRMALQVDGRLVVYDAAGTELWSAPP